MDIDGLLVPLRQLRGGACARGPTWVLIRDGAGWGTASSEASAGSRSGEEPSEARHPGAPSGSRTKTSTARSGSMWLSLMKPTTRRCVSLSISRLTSCSMTPCHRRRRSSTAASSPASERFCSPRVSVSSRTTKMPSSPIVVFALVGPRPVVRASMVTTAFEMAAASSPSDRWLFAVTAVGFGPCAECGGHGGGESSAHFPPPGRDVKPASALSFEAEHVGACLAEEEELDRDVRLDARLAQERPHDATRRLLDDARELLGHGL